MRPIVPALLLTLLAPPARAQLAVAPSAPSPAAALAIAVTPAADSAPWAGAPVRDAAVGLRPTSPVAAPAAVYAAPRRRGYGRSVALMAVGGGAVVIGALAGGDAGGVLILGGAVVGLIGLYEYLR